MTRMYTRLPLLFLIGVAALSQQIPHPLPDGYALPNGWRITPIGKAIPTEDMVLNVKGNERPGGISAIIRSHVGSILRYPHHHSGRYCRSGHGVRALVMYDDMTHTGDGLGMPPTNKKLETTGISIVRVVDGKLAAGWQNWDMLGLLQQIQVQPRAATYIAPGEGV